MARSGSRKTPERTVDTPSAPAGGGGGDEKLRGVAGAGATAPAASTGSTQAAVPVPVYVMNSAGQLVRLDTLSANVKNETHAPETPASATVQLLPGTNIPKRLIKLEATPLSLRVVLDASIPVMYDHVKSDGCDSPILSSGHPLTLLGQPSDVIVKVVFITSGPAKITSLWRDSLKLR